MKKILVICGPTATGKTSLGLKLAKNLNGELVSADSRQVYRGMDIGTGKDVGNSKLISNNILPTLKCRVSSLKENVFVASIHTRNELRGILEAPNNKFQIGYYLFKNIKIWLLDIVEPDYQFTVADYVKYAGLVIEKIWQRGKLPIIVGGTGLYIKGIVDGIDTIGVKPDWGLREKLNTYSVIKLQNLLEKTCPGRSQRMNESDINNPRRLIRAIEIAIKIKNQKSKIKTTTKNSKRYDTLIIGLTASYITLYQRIDKRVDERIENGLEEEIKKLLDNGYNWDNSVLGTTIGYKEWRRADSLWQIDDEIKSKIIQRWKLDEHGYSRRQMTWFKKDARVKWFDISSPDWQDRIEDLVKNWYNT
ncbi:MAG: tRNA (adenosine(37)-N6)-dimethylallyltransferase MiaA [Candidatus Gottesmanbacteria bacterium]